MSNHLHPKTRRLLLRDALLAAVARIPGTRQYRHRYIHTIVETTQRRMSRFRDLQTIDPIAKRDIAHAMRHHLIRIAASEEWVNMVWTLAFSLTVLPIFIFSYGLVIIIYLWASPEFLPILIDPLNNFFRISSSSIAMLVALVVLVIPIFLRARISSSLSVFIVARSAVNIWLVVVIFAYMAIVLVLGPGAGTYASGSLQQALLVGASVASGAFLFTTSIGTLQMYVLTRYKWRVFYLIPDSVLLDKLLHVLVEIESQPNQWTNLNCKQRWMQWLEDAALAVQVYLPHRLQSGDLDSDAIQQDIANRIAASLRNLKMWIFTPKLDTRECLLARLSHDMIVVAKGNWDDLEQSEPIHAKDMGSWRSRAWSILKTLFIGVIPVIVLWILQSSPALALGDPVAEYAKVGVLLWGLLSVIAVLDPLFGTKLGALKDIYSLLPLPSKSNSNKP